MTAYILIQSLDPLGDRINTEIIRLSEFYAEQIRDHVQTAYMRMGAPETPSELQRDTEIKTYLDSLVADQEEIIYVFIQDLSGEVLWDSLKRGMELEKNHFSKALVSTKNPRPPRMELTSLTNPQNRFTDLIEPIFLNDQTQLVAHLGLDNSLLEKRFGALRGKILNRILLASSGVVAILTVALFYVLWLLKRAQLVEAEAHIADRLAYLGTLASGLAHEIRNPLSAMNLNIQMIEEEMNPKAGSDLGVLLAGTKQEISRLERLATAFLLYAKPIILERQEFAVPELFNDVTLLMSRECERNGIRLVVENSDHAPKINADRDSLKQALLNLIVNAQDSVNARASGDKIIRLNATRQENQVVIRVWDNGSGIGSEDAKNLFKLFYSTKRGGTGLGLPIAQRIIESHGGRIEWENHSQGGAEFRMVLPIQ